MKEIKMFVSPVFSLDGIEVDEEVKKLKKDIEKILKKNYKNLTQRDVLLEGFPYLLKQKLAPADNGLKKLLSVGEVVNELEKDKLQTLPLPYLLGLFSLKEKLASFFPQGILSLEIFDEQLHLFRFNRKKSLCIKMKKGNLILCISEYIENETVNASGRISPNTILFPCDYTEKISEEASQMTERVEAPEEKQVFKEEDETPEARHNRLANTQIGGIKNL